MRGKRVLAPEWIVLLAVGLASATLLACIIPSALTRAVPSQEPTAPPAVTQASPTAPSVDTPAPGSAETVTRITEQQLNDYLRGYRTSLGEGLECEEMEGRIHSDGITLLATVKVDRLQGALVPVEADLMPSVSGGRVRVQVQDVRLGGGYSAMSTLIKPVLTSGIADSFANGFTFEKMLAERGVRITDVQLHNGYMDVTSVQSN